MKKIEKIIFEISDGWARDYNSIQKNSTHRQFLGNFLSILSLKEIPISVISTNFPSYGEERIEFKNHLTFSFHSYENKTNTWSYKESPIVNKYSIDKSGYCGWSDITINFDNYRDQINSISIQNAEKIISAQYNKFLSTKLSKYEQNNNIEKLPERYVFFPLQVVNDSAAKHANLDMIEVIEYISKLASDLKFNVVIKRHPLCPSSAIKNLLKIIQIENKYIQLSDSNVHDLIKNSHSVISCNSGVSLEALIANKAVYCFGKSEWYEASNKINNLSDINKVFSNELTYMNDFQKKIVAFLLSEYWCDFNDLNKIERIIDNCIATFKANSGTPNNSSEIELIIKQQLDLQSKLSDLERNNKLLKIESNRLKEINKKLRNNPIIIIKMLLKKLLH